MSANVSTTPKQSLQKTGSTLFDYKIDEEENGKEKMQSYGVLMLYLRTSRL